MCSYVIAVLKIIFTDQVFHNNREMKAIVVDFTRLDDTLGLINLFLRRLTRLPACILQVKVVGGHLRRRVLVTCELFTLVLTSIRSRPTRRHMEICSSSARLQAIIDQL